PPPPPPPQPIVNGNDARPDTWPWQAALFYFKKQLCGASLLDERHVVTAAHCLDSEPSDYTLMLGSIEKSSEASGNLFTNRASFIQVQNFTVHPNYTSFCYYWGNDIAILRLATPVRFNRALSPVCLIDPQYDVITTSSICYALGWGLTNFYNSTSDATILQVAKLKLWSWDECRKTNFFISPSMICAGYTGGIIANCKGDSGGPLVCRNSISSGSSSINSFSPWRLVGVFTFLSTGCDVVMKPSVFTNVSYHSQWLKSAM
ncbi:hypothetical protein HELRODRAFT_140768, partial [Helobdella robusta]|uniref:Peptidase S1 domain-containing protein n=1 Tax=Helobdella robusta TaxID=6412 RepID=T1EJ18_HELRO